MTAAPTPVLTAHWDEPGSFTIKGNWRAGGYLALTRALRIEPGEIMEDLDKLPGISDNIPAGRSARWAMRPPARSCRRSATSALSSPGTRNAVAAPSNLRPRLSGASDPMTPASSAPAPRQPMEAVTVTIDGFEIAAPRGTLIIRAAEQIGIAIRFCDHPLLDRSAPAGR